MDNLLVDLRYAFRTLRRSRAFAAVAIVTMALGIGANAAMFSYVDAVVLQSLPFPQPQRLVEVWETYEAEGLELRNVSYAAVLDWRERIDSFEHLAALNGVALALTDMGEAQLVPGQVVDAQFFDLLGVAPSLGRTFEDADNRDYEQAPVVVLSHSFWQSTLGGDHDVLGRTILLNGIAATVVGVMPAGFNDPYGSARLWLPFRPGLRVAQVGADELEGRGNRGFRALARLAPDATLERVQQQLDAVTLQFREEHPGGYIDRGALLMSLEERVLGPTRGPVLLLMGAVGLVLLIACVNVANLMMARAADRREEIAMRFALGAGRARLVRQLLTESVVLAAIAGVAGLLLAIWSLDALAAQLPFAVPQYVSVGINPAVVLFTVGITLLTGILFGLLPALTTSRARLAGRIGSMRGGSGRGGRIAGLDLRGALVAAEVALSLMLLVGAALLLQSFAGMRALDPGFEPEGLLTFNINLPASDYDADQVAVFRDELAAALRGMPGVEAAALAGGAPLVSSYSAFLIATEEGAAADPAETIRVYRHSITPGYVETLGAELLAGRELGRGDTAESPPVMLVSKTFAERTWPGADPIGKRLTGNGTDWITVVGMLGDISHRQLVVDTFTNPDDPDVYFPMAQAGQRGLSVLVRTQRDPDALLDPIRQQVRRLDPDLPVFGETTMADAVAAQLDVNRTSARLLTGFGALALLLAAIGIYGVMATAVAARGREIGIRIALGASRTHVVSVVLTQAVTMAAVGVAVGVAAALAATRLLQGLLFEVDATDPVTITVVALALLVVTVLASAVPLRRALAVDPATALQGE